MSISQAEAEHVLAAALEALDGAAAQIGDKLDALPAPVYATDPDGVITHFNRACIDFAGRVPVAGEDRWCVTWKLFTEDGRILPHEDCPMAVAIRAQRKIRGLRAITERPDGSRRTFEPFPTPYFDRDGDFAGAVNLLVDLGADTRLAELEQQARKCRRLASGISDPRMIESLRLMAAEYEDEARRLRGEG